MTPAQLLVKGAITHVQSSTTEADWRWIQAGKKVTTSAQELAPALSGWHVHLTDVYVRAQPSATGECSVTIRTAADDETVLKLYNSTRANPKEWKIKCDIYLPLGQGLEVIGSTNAENRSTCCVL